MAALRGVRGSPAPGQEATGRLGSGAGLWGGRIPTLAEGSRLVYSMDPYNLIEACSMESPGTSVYIVEKQSSSGPVIQSGEGPVLQNGEEYSAGAL